MLSTGDCPRTLGMLTLWILQMSCFPENPSGLYRRQKVHSSSRSLDLDHDCLIVPLGSGSFTYPMCPSTKPITAFTVSLLLGLEVTGAATRTSAFVLQGKNYDSLRAASDLDVVRIETSISHLQESLTSLSEEVLQNRRGLTFPAARSAIYCLS